MDRAFFHAARGRGRTSPNPLVGAVVVIAGRASMVGQGYHERAGEPHAEIRALARWRVRWRVARRCTVRSSRAVITARTGPCVTRIVDAGIDAGGRGRRKIRIRWCSGRGFAFLREHGVTVDVGSGRTARGRAQPAVLHADAGTAVRSSC